MKRMLVLFLIAAMVLCGCGGGGEETSVPTTVPETTAAPTTVPTTVPPETTIPVETTEPVVLFTHPLTGEALDAAFDVRPLAIMINNINKAAPQCGISQADILYEVLAEGSVTRFMAIFTELEDVGVIGPVRSVRPYFVRIAQHYDVILSSAGGSEEAYDLIDDLDLDYLNAIGSAGNYFYRDEWRKNNRGYEHSLMTTGSKLTDAIENWGLDIPVEGADYGLTFDDTVLPAGGEAAPEIGIHFYKNGKLTRMTWNPDTNLYAMYQHGADALDANDDTPLAFRNILVLKSSTKITDGQGHLAMDMTGEGEGYFARDGVIIPIKWSRDSYDGLYRYTDLDGNPIVFGVGKSYIAIVPVESNIDFGV